MAPDKARSARPAETERDAVGGKGRMAVRLAEERVQWSELFNREYGAAVVLMCLGVWLHAADSLFVATMLPTVVSEIGGQAFISWTFALYEVGSIVAAAASGLLTIKLGIRRPVMLAAGIFAFGCLASALAPNMAIMLIGRSLQGAGGGGMVAISFVAAAVLFPSRLVVRAMGAIAGLWGVSAFLGPLLGSLFVTYSDWRLGFAFFGAKACILIGWTSFGPQITERRGIEQSNPTFPFWRLMVLCAAILLVAVSGLDVDPVKTPALLASGIAILAGFVFLDGKCHENRLLPENVCDLRIPANLILALIFLLHLATTGLITYGPFLLLAIHGTSAITAGYAIACLSIGWSVAAVLVSGSPESHDLRYIAVGVIMVALSVPGLLISVQFGPVWLICAFALLEGAGQGTSRSFLVRRAIILAGPDDKERISGAIPTISRTGYALGAAISGILANSAGFSTGGGAEQAMRVAQFVFAGAVPCALLSLAALALLLNMCAGNANSNTSD